MSIDAINPLIIPKADRYKLTAIAIKLHQSIQLTQSEKQYWKNFAKEEKSYIITGDSQHTLDFPQYHEGYFSGDYWTYLEPELHNQNPPTNPIDDKDPEPDLFADKPPLTSSSEESIPVFRRTGTLDSTQSQKTVILNKVQGLLHRTVSLLQNRVRLVRHTTLPAAEEFSTTPQMLAKQKGRPKGSKNIKQVCFHPEAIGQRTRAKLPKGYTMKMEIILCLCSMMQLSLL